MAEGRRAAPRGGSSRSRRGRSGGRAPGSGSGGGYYDYNRPERGRSDQTPDQRRPRRSSRLKRSPGARVAGALLYVLLVIGLSGILDTLEREGLIEYKFLFKLFSWFSHAEEKIAPGTYTLDTEMDYRALISNMGSSSTTRKTVDITIPEGYTIDQLFDLLDKRGVASVDRLRDMSANWDYAFDWLEGLPLGDYHRLEGYLFPDTYTFEMGENPKYVLNKMLVNFDSKMDQYLDRFTGEGEDAPAYSLHDIVTIASLIEKETDGTNTDERSDYKSIASVIYNRLEHPEAETVGLLQIDATLVYLNGGKVPTEADKAIDSPYNTYKYQGLPPGPIANPGMTSLLAAMDPDSTSYYYYALNPETKQHEYSRTLAEHQAKLDRFAAANNG